MQLYTTIAIVLVLQSVGFAGQAAACVARTEGEDLLPCPVDHEVGIRPVPGSEPVETGEGPQR